MSINNSLLSNKDTLFFKLHANCIPVQGAKRSIICDLQMMRYKYIPNLLYDILIQAKDKTVGELKAANDQTLNEGIDRYFDRLEKEEWGIYTDIPQHFPDLSLEWEFPGMISNALIDRTAESAELDYATVFTELSSLGCTAIQLRYFDPISLPILHEILQNMHNTTFEYVELLLQYTPELADKSLIDLFRKNLRVRYITIVNAPEDRELFFEASTENVTIRYSQEMIHNKHYCGVVHPYYFEVNIDLFTEAQKHNTCLNRKIAIDEQGNIKNCPSMQKTYGNIATTNLKTVVLEAEFRKYWNLHKDQIEVCRDCEFRYICTDCRAYRSNDNDLLSKPKKCNYDPYTATWS